MIFNPFLQLLLLVSLFLCKTESAINNFLFNGFHGSNLILSNSATITTTGALQLTNTTTTSLGLKGHAIYPTPFKLKDSTSARRIQSFSTRFVFEIVSEFNESGGHGFAFFMAPSTDFSAALGSHFLGLFNASGNGSSSNPIFAVEFDTVHSSPDDIDANHVGVDMNSIASVVSKTASYYTENGKNERVVLDSKMPIQAWIDYDGNQKFLNVSLAPLTHPLKPNRSLVSYGVDLASILREFVYVGFSSSTQKLVSEHYILAWSFSVNGDSASLDLSRLPSVPNLPIRSPEKPQSGPLLLIISIVSSSLFLFLIIFTVCYVMYRRRELVCEKMEGWELNYPHRLPYKEVYKATKGFNEKEVLGRGGFGSVYKGVLAKKGKEVAVKRVSQGSKQGMREFVAEVSSLGSLRHRNLVPLQGWCRRGEDLLLVYDFMPNGSLDSFLFGERIKRVLRWEERFKILKGIASGLLYLHEGWDQIVVHRDVKASNVLLDVDMHGRLSDFGLARLYEHGCNPQTTRVAGTLGYMAPELSWTWKATPSSDVFSYGALLLEVASGRRPIEPETLPGELGGLLVERVSLLWKDGQILNAVDRRLGLNYVREEAEVVLKLGVMCSHSAPETRPSMRQVVQFLDGDASLQDLEQRNLVIDENHYPSENESSISSPSADC